MNKEVESALETNGIMYSKESDFIQFTLCTNMNAKFHTLERVHI